MKFRLLLLTVFLGLVVSAAQGGLFKNSVDLADLSEVAPESLDTLQETEFAVFLAQVYLNTAKAAERRAEGALKAADRNVDAESLDMKAVKAELKAAKANQDEERLAAAKARIAGAEQDLETAKTFRKWKSQEQEARQAEVWEAKSALDLAEARRDVARVRLLSQEGASSAGKYDVEDFERSVAKRQKEYDTASRKARDSAGKLVQLESDWNRLAKNLEE